MKQKKRDRATRRGHNPDRREIRRRRAQRRRRQRRLTAVSVALALIMLGMGIYAATWYVNLDRIRRDSARYAGLYGGESTAAPEGIASAAPTLPPTAEPTAIPTPEPTLESTPVPTAIPTPTPSPEPAMAATHEVTATAPETSEAPSAAPTPTATAEPTAVPTTESTAVPTAEPTEAPTIRPTPTVEPTLAPTATPSPTPVPFGMDMPIVEDVPIPTPGSDTLVVALPTTPPVQESFEALLALNPETVGFLTIEEMLSLPVAQRENDNEYYLSHTFEGAEASEGALFLDGMNRLSPEDDCLIVYGHNMKNKTMFGRLNTYEDVNYLRRNSVIRFDTLYENRSYVVFAAFTASMDPKNPRYFDVRNFIFDEAGFDKFILKLQSRSMYRSPIDVAYGDHLLLLVTCDYTSAEGRFILALRQLRQGENDAEVWARAMQTAIK